MSEAQEGYTTDALEMIGVLQSKKIETVISGFVPMFNYVANYYKDNITALVFGRRWQYCGMEDGVCRASLSKIANDLYLDEATVMRHTEKLVKDGFLVDTTPTRRNRPHVYKDGGKVTMKTYLNAHIAQSNVGIAQSNVGIAQSKLIKQDKTINKTSSDSSNKPTTKAKLPENSDLAFLLATGQDITDEAQQARIIEHNAIVAFEASFNAPKPLAWFCGKPKWTELRNDVVTLYKADPQCFDKYKVWRLTPYAKGTVSLKDIQRDPDCFMASWAGFSEATQPKQEENRIPKVTIVK